MRRTLVSGLVTLLVAAPLMASAAVPDPRFEGALVGGGAGPAAVASAVGDVTGDGTLDLIVARGAGPGPDAYTVAVFAGPLTGTLPTSPTFVVRPSARSAAYRLAVGDLDHDGFGDLAVADVNGVDAVGAAAPAIDVFLQSGGSLPASPSQIMSIPVRDVVATDMDGDGRDDLLYTRRGATPIEVRLRVQEADGSFGPSTALLTNAPADRLATGDVNADGLRDAMVDGEFTGAVPVLVQSAVDHSFGELDVPLPGGIAALVGAALTDLDDDGDDDLLILTDADTGAWALADGAGGFGAFSAEVPMSTASAKEVADLNGDGRADLATFGADGAMRVYLQQDTGGLGAPCWFPATATPGTDAASASGDVTDDGATDLVDADVGGTSGGAWLFRQLTGGELLETGVEAQASHATMRAGTTLTISGTFINDLGGCLRADTVSLIRSAGGIDADLGDASIASDGTFSFHDVPAKAGDVDYVVHFAGDETHAPAESLPLHVTVTKVPTSLSLAISKKVITYGQATELRATLEGSQPTSSVRFERKAGATWQLLDAVEVGDDGVALLSVHPDAEARYRAVFATTAAQRGSVSSTVSVGVHPVMVSRMLGGTKDGRYTVYRCCTGFFYVKLKPPHPGVSWTAIAQYHGKGRWRPLGSGSYRIEKDGDAAIYLNAVRGYRYRVRGHFKGDADHLSANSAWNYFRFKG